jgi:heavy metal sensor kinase
VFFRTIKFRLTLWYLVVLIVLLVFFGFISYFLLSNDLYQNLDNSLRTRAVDIVAGGRPVQSTPASELGEIVLIYNSQGNLILPIETSNLQLDASTVQTLINNATTNNSSIFSASTSDGQIVRLYSTSITIQMPPNRAPIIGILVIGRSIAGITQAMDIFWQVIIIGGLVTLVLAAGGGIFLTARVLKPIDEITRTAHGIEEKDLSRRIKVNTDDELGRLAATLNEMIDRLEKAFERQRQFTADASHELRTPLSVIEAESTLALSKPRSAEDYQQSLESITQETAYMSAILEKLLMLARADAGKEPLTFETTNLRELIGKLTQDVELLASEKGISFVIDTIEELSVMGNKIKLRQLFLNIFDNAIKYTPKGEIHLSLRQRDAEAVVEISDTGIGISEEDIPHIFERFYRVDKARSRSEHGTGLGLAISKYIVESHGGRIEVTSQIDVGSTFTVFLPLIN